MSGPEELKEFDPNLADDGSVTKALLPRITDFLTGRGIKAFSAEEWTENLYQFAGVKKGDDDTITKALAHRADALTKSIQAPPTAYSFAQASMMPDPAGGNGVMPWPGISPNALAKIVQENVAPQLIMGMRIDDILRYSLESSHPWKPGWHFELTQGQGQPTKSDLKDMQAASLFLQNSNVETGNRTVRERDSKNLNNFQQFLSMMTRDTLTYDGIAIWKKLANDKSVIEYKLMPSSYIRLVDQKIGYNGDTNVYAVLVQEGNAVAKDEQSKDITFTRDDLIWYTRNPRIDPYIGLYGYSEVEIGVRLIQGFQNAIDLNCDTFNRNGIPNGMLLLKGGGWVQKQLDVLMRMWTNLKKGITKVWALPVLAAPINGEIEVVNLNDLKGTDVRYEDHMNMMIGAFCTIFRFPVHRLGYRISGKGRDTHPQPDSQARIIDEDDPGLSPLLGHIETLINEYLIWPKWPGIRFAFTGKSPKEDAREYDFRKNTMTWAEARKEADLPELKTLIKGNEFEDFTQLMGLCPLDPNMAGVFQTALAMVLKSKADAENGVGGGRDPKTPGNENTSARDPAKTEGHGYPSGVKRQHSKENRSEKAAASKETLYVSRHLLNADEIIEWAQEQGFVKTLTADDMHVTIAFSRDPVYWSDVPDSFDAISAPPSLNRTVTPLGDKGAIVLKFKSRELEARWKEFCEHGCSWDYESYQPHITITYDGGDMNLTDVKPFIGELHFGPEKFAKLNPEWDTQIEEV